MERLQGRVAGAELSLALTRSPSLPSAQRATRTGARELCEPTPSASVSHLFDCPTPPTNPTNISRRAFAVTEGSAFAAMHEERPSSRALRQPVRVRANTTLPYLPYLRHRHPRPPGSSHRSSPIARSADGALRTRRVHAVYVIRNGSHWPLLRGFARKQTTGACARVAAACCLLRPACLLYPRVICEVNSSSAVSASGFLDLARHPHQAISHR